MVKVKIFGAGSIGTHLAHGCRRKDWDVTVNDIDVQALERMKKEIYPARYGEWDDNIRLTSLPETGSELFDVVIIGTPPDTHITIALEVLRKQAPKVMLIEKPLCTPLLQECQELWELACTKKTVVLTGYNHVLTENTQKAQEYLARQALGEPLTMTALFREHWGGIFSAHPWLKGPQDTYLGFYERGGGAGGEHSHAINIWQHFAHGMGWGRVNEVSAMLDIVDDGNVKYDRICQLHVKTEKGLIGNIVQDVVTQPTKKYVRIQGSQKALEWHVNWKKDCDAVLVLENGSQQIQEIPKKRSDDFKWEIDHVGKILNQPDLESPISLKRGMETMMVIAAVHLSHRINKTVKIDYQSGYCLEALKTIA